METTYYCKYISNSYYTTKHRAKPSFTMVNSRNQLSQKYNKKVSFFCNQLFLYLSPFKVY